MKTVKNDTIAKSNSTILDKISSKIMNLTTRVEKIKGCKLEMIVLALYCVLHCVMGIFHEPWFDEAQAWNIARDASLSEVLFEVPHYEGHPALWHLILMPFAKLGLNYEMSLCFVSLVFSGLAVYLLLFKSPFPRIVKITLPFTYFMFYQYGVISRPYCIMVLASCLLAMAYAKRNERPGRYTWCLVLMCMTSAYGIVISGGLATVWVVEIVREKVKAGDIQGLFRDKRCYMLLGLLVYAVCIVVRIIPRDSIAASSYEEDVVNGVGVRLIYNFFALISDLFITNAYGEYTFLKKIDFYTYELVIACILGAILLAIISCLGRKKNKLLLFWVPYSMFAVFGAMVYMCIHHTGTIWALILFWLWVCFKEQSIDNRVEFRNIQIRNGLIVLITVAIIIPLIWTVSACIREILCSYAPSREIYQFITDNELEDKNILVGWTEYLDDDGKLIAYDMKHSADEVILSPYGLSDNILNWQQEEKLFPLYHRVVSDAENETIKKNIANSGTPDIIIGTLNLFFVYGENVEQNDYILVKRIEASKIWKGLQYPIVTYVYLHKDIYGKLSEVK